MLATIPPLLRRPTGYHLVSAGTMPRRSRARPAETRSRTGAAVAAVTGPGASADIAKLAEEFLEAPGRLPAASVAHRERALGLPVAVDDDLRDLLQLRVPDSLAERLVTLVHIGTEAGSLEPAPDLLDRPTVVGPHRNDPHLHR